MMWHDVGLLPEVGRSYYYAVSRKDLAAEQVTPVLRGTTQDPKTATPDPPKTHGVEIKRNVRGLTIHTHSSVHTRTHKLVMSFFRV